MKIVLFGKNGQLGWELNRALNNLGELIALDYPEVDFEKPRAVVNILDDIKPSLIINAAAYTDVDRAEIEKERARLVNAETPGEIANWCKKKGSILIHYSTDYVFNGKKKGPYSETDIPSPINYYGQTKLDGETLIQDINPLYLIIRTAWLYSLRGNNFLVKFLGWLKNRNEVSIVADQFGNPTSAPMLADCTSIILTSIIECPDLIEVKKGLYHCVPSGCCSRFQFAEAILRYGRQYIKRNDIILRSATSDEFNFPAKRPKRTILSNQKIIDAFSLKILSWEDYLKKLFCEL